MNLYDTKQICCIKCSKFVGEIDWNIKIAYILCANCQNLALHDKIDFQKHQFENEISSMKQVHVCST